MTSKSDRLPADLKTVEPRAAEPQAERMPSAVGEISALASAHAPIIFFDEVAFCSSSSSIGGVTLVAARQIAHLPGRGVVSDRAIVVHLRASLPALLALRATIDEVERLAKGQAEAAIAAIEAEADAPSRLPH